MRAYKKRTQSRLEASDDEWNSLKTFLDEIQVPLKEAIQTHDIEESIPRIDADGKFEPGGWVGTYPGGITVTPSGEKLSRSEYECLMEALRSWTEILGAPTISSILPFSPDVLMDEQSLYASYSRQLINYTELVLAHRPPVEVNLETSRGHVVQGRPLFRETMREQFRQSSEVVSQNIEFSFRTLPNFLLTRFHAELAGRLQKLASAYDYFQSELKHQIEYHREFIESGIPADLLAESLEIDFFSPEILAKTRRRSGKEMNEIVDLWEAFQHRLSMSFDVDSRLDTAIKPISKLYELWCLRVLVDVLEEITQTKPTMPESFPGVFRFGRTKLHYNRYLRSKSRYIKHFGADPGRPDYMLEFGDEILWVGDAKFKSAKDINQSDYIRFLTYLTDYLEPTPLGLGTLLYPTGRPRNELYEGSEYTISHVRLRPDSSELAVDNIRDHFEQCLTA